MNEQEYLAVRVTAVRAPAERGPHTVLLGDGTLLGHPDHAITFAGDQRMMLDMAMVLPLGEVVAMVAPWQVLWQQRGDPRLN